MRELKYAKRLLFKEWIPLIAVFLVVAVLSGIISVASYSFYEDHTFGIAAFTVPASMLAVVMPFFVYSYRFRRIGGDTYYQLPFKEKEFKNLRVLTGLVAVIFVFTVAFIIGYAVFAISYGIAPKTTTINAWNAQTETYGPVQIPKLVINLGYMLLAYPVSLVSISGVYFITTTIVSLTNRLPSAMIYVFVVQVLLAGLLPIFGLYIYENMARSDFWAEFATITLALSPSSIGANVLAQQFGFGANFTLDSNNNLFDTIRYFSSYGFNSMAALAIVMLIVDLVIFVGAAFLTLLGSEPSGEFNGTSGARNKKLNYLLYLLTIFVGLASSFVATNNVFIYAFIVVFYVAGLYIMMSIYLGTFKIGSIHGVFIGASGLFLILMPFITIAIEGTLWASGYH